MINNMDIQEKVKEFLKENNIKDFPLKHNKIVEGKFCQKITTISSLIIEFNKKHLPLHPIGDAETESVKMAQVNHGRSSIISIPQYKHRK